LFLTDRNSNLALGCSEVNTYQLKHTYIACSLGRVSLLTASVNESLTMAILFQESIITTGVLPSSHVIVALLEHAVLEVTKPFLFFKSTIEAVNLLDCKDVVA